MMVLEFAIGKRDLLSARKMLADMHFADMALICRNQDRSVYRALIEDGQLVGVVAGLRRAMPSFSLTAVLKDVRDFLPKETPPDHDEGLRALGDDALEGEHPMRRMFGFKTWNE